MGFINQLITGGAPPCRYCLYMCIYIFMGIQRSIRPNGDTPSIGWIMPSLLLVVGGFLVLALIIFGLGG